jgi:hypothetical protein
MIRLNLTESLMKRKVRILRNPTFPGPLCNTECQKKTGHYLTSSILKITKATRTWATPYRDTMPESRNSGARVTFIATLRLGKHVPATTNRQATIDVFLSYDNRNGVFCWIRPAAI